ncbi:MAG TPA: hypothetical protein VGA99_02555 [bacterium]
MSTIFPEGEAVRRAIKWISERAQAHPDEKIHNFVSEAITRFDLSPKDADFLFNFYRSQKS